MHADRPHQCKCRPRLLRKRGSGAALSHTFSILYVHRCLRKPKFDSCTPKKPTRAREREPHHVPKSFCARGKLRNNSACAFARRWRFLTHSGLPDLHNTRKHDLHETSGRREEKSRRKKKNKEEAGRGGEQGGSSWSNVQGRTKAPNSWDNDARGKQLEQCAVLVTRPRRWIGVAISRVFLVTRRGRKHF